MWYCCHLLSNCIKKSWDLYTCTSAAVNRLGMCVIARASSRVPEVAASIVTQGAICKRSEFSTIIIVLCICSAVYIYSTTFPSAVYGNGDVLCHNSVYMLHNSSRNMHCIVRVWLFSFLPIRALKCWGSNYVTHIAKLACHGRYMMQESRK